MGTKKPVSAPIKIPVAQKKCEHCGLNCETPAKDVMRYEIATLKMYERIMRHKMRRCKCCGAVPLDHNVAPNEKMEDSCKCACQCKKRGQVKEDTDEDIFAIDI